MVVVVEVMTDVKIIVALYSVDLSSDVTAGLVMDVLANIMLGGLAGISAEVLADLNANARTVVVPNFGFSLSTPSEEFSR